MFQTNQIDFQKLRERAYNLRWASVPEDVIPLTAADPDFKCAPVIQEAIEKYTRGGYFSMPLQRAYPNLKKQHIIFSKGKDLT